MVTDPWQCNDWRVAVLCGGESSERAVSLSSGRSVAGALTAAGFSVDCLELDENRLPGALEPHRHLVIPMIHGRYGEDGQLSADLERAGFGYAGSGMTASVLCYDKVACKGLATAIGLPTAAHQLIHPDAIPAYEVLADRLGLPFVLKPRSDGSSCGLYIIHAPGDYAAAGVALAAMPYVAESYLAGVDITVGVLAGRSLEVVMVEPMDGGYYDYQHKYTPGKTRYTVPAPLPESVRTCVRAAAESIFAACGCRDFARVDFRWDGEQRCTFLEVNTIPGMTQTSLLPMSAQAVGISYTDLIQRWVGFARSRVKDSITRRGRNG